MSKQHVDDLIHNMKLAGIVTKASAWMVEGNNLGNMNTRYVGIQLSGDWLDILPKENNLLLKFVIDKNTASVEFYIANKPPFFKFTNRQFTQEDKWEYILGEVKRKLKKDKTEYINHTSTIGNLYERIHAHLK